MAQGCKRTIEKTTSFKFHSLKYLIFSFSHPDNAKHGVELRHLKRNSSRIQRKVGNENVLIRTECLNTSSEIPCVCVCPEIQRDRPNKQAHPVQIRVAWSARGAAGAERARAPRAAAAHERARTTVLDTYSAVDESWPSCSSI